MKKKLSSLPIINQNLDKEFTKNSNKLLRELLAIFIEETPHLQQEINEAFHTQQSVHLNNLLHKLYGSCIYCGLDRLKECIIALNKAAKNNNYPLSLLETFNKEVRSAIEAAKKI